MGPALPWRKGYVELLRASSAGLRSRARDGYRTGGGRRARAPRRLAFVWRFFCGIALVDFTARRTPASRDRGVVLVALWRVCASNRRRYGGYVVHFGVLVLGWRRCVRYVPAEKSGRCALARRGVSDATGCASIRGASMIQPGRCHRRDNVSVGDRVLPSQPPTQLLQIGHGADRHAGGA